MTAQQRTIEELLHEFLEYLTRRRFMPDTVGDYRRTILVFLAYLAENFPEAKGAPDVNRDMVRSYEKYLTTRIDARGKVMSRGRRGTHLSSLKAFFRYLEREERIYANPAANMAMPKVRQRLVKDVLTVEEMDRLLKACAGHSLQGLRDRALLELLYSTGIRAEELCSLHVSDVDCTEKLLFVRQGKFGRERLVPFGESARYWITRYLDRARPLMKGADSERLFMTIRGTKITPDSLRGIVSRWATVAGIEKNVTTHTFRHTCATHLLKGRADIRYVQQQLGHRFISTTEKYLKIEITDLKEVHERCHPREQEDWGEKKS
jgi:integrase/recombinase XerD